MNDKLKFQILQKVQDQKMVKSWFWQIQNWLILASILFFVILASFLLASFLTDLNQIQNIITDDFWSDFGNNFWQNSFLELIFLSFLLGLFIFWLYQKTDWLLVRHKNYLLLTVLSVILLLGSLGSLAEKKHFEIVQENLENFNYRQNRRQNLTQNMKKRNVFVGKIRLIDNEKKLLKVENLQVLETFFWDNYDSQKGLNQQQSQEYSFNSSQISSQILTENQAQTKPQNEVKNQTQKTNLENFPKENDLNNSKTDLEKTIKIEKEEKLQKNNSDKKRLKPKKEFRPENFQIGQKVWVNYQKIDEKLLILQIRPF